MLGGNADTWQRPILRKAGLSDELIAEATGYAETDNKEILDARDMFAKALEKHREEISGEADKVREAGGLFIIGTERHDSRRIDNQLRGRAAVRATRARRASTSRLKTICCACLAASASRT